MGKYVVSVENTASEGKCMLSLHSDGVVAPQIVGIKVACVEETPADEKFEFALHEVTSEGTSGTAVEISKIGMCADPSCNALAGTFSSQPTKLDDDKRLATFAPHRRATDRDKDAPGDGLELTGLADGRGFGIFCVQAPSASKHRFEITFLE